MPSPTLPSLTYFRKGSSGEQWEGGHTLRDVELNGSVLFKRKALVLSPPRTGGTIYFFKLLDVIIGYPLVI